ncbi:MAG: hypothetical protein RL026_1939 [Pseudomonadota bacterium]|jgi:PhzF family phenazine biosynthesis protein
MSRSVEVFQVDAFTTERFTGNPAGVVLGAEVLSDGEMLAIARELNNADTAFVMPATGKDHDIRVRFFTPRVEAAFVGHATLAVHTVLVSRTPRAVCRQAGNAGVVEVSRTRDGGGFSIKLPPPQLGRVLDGDERTSVLDALGLAAPTLDLRAPMRIAGGGGGRLLIGVESASTLDRLQPDLAHLTRLSASLGAAGYFLFTLAPAQPGCAVESRMFCPALGIPEDPVSGNAHSLLAAHLLDLGLLPVVAGRLQFSGTQGHHLGRPGRVDVTLDVDAAGRCTAAHIAGRAVRVFGTRIDLD